MIQLTIDSPLREAGIAAAAAAFNATQPEGTVPLTPAEWLQARIDGAADGWASEYRIGIVSSGDYVLRFTASENGAITAAAETDPIVAGLLARVRESSEVVLYADEVVQGVGYLVAQGLLTQQRADAILGY